MESNIGDIIKVGVVLIIVCSIIFTVLNINTISKGLTSEGSNQLQNVAGQFLESRYYDFHQITSTGTSVKGTLSMFSANPIAICVQSNTMQGTGKDGFGTFAVYNARLRGVSEVNDSVGTGGEDTWTITASETSGSDFYYDSTDGFYHGSIELTDGRVSYNLNGKPMANSGTAYTIKDTGQYMGTLILDSSETIIGIAFAQIDG